MRIDEHRGQRVLRLDPEGPAITDAGDVIGDVWAHEAQMVVVPAARLDPEFFRLRSGVAGEFLQKLVNYRIRLAVVGDITAYVEASDALRDLVRESNAGTQAWFFADEAALGARLGPVVDAS
ncbi:DUF4180 domain-containing protein [Mumia sp. Pv 4-285]|uniref:DUF4180 domain-containing protein n=1 Tax=Mumia qirimensis TaxID=3234852 RepID=UPI00351D3A8C